MLAQLIKAFLSINPTPTPSQHNGPRSQPGLPSYQPVPYCMAMAQGVRLWIGLWAVSG